MNIDDALRALAEREQWELDDLPDGVGLDELRVLATRQLVYPPDDELVHGRG